MEFSVEVSDVRKIYLRWNRETKGVTSYCPGISISNGIISFDGGPQIGLHLETPVDAREFLLGMEKAIEIAEGQISNGRTSSD